MVYCLIHDAISFHCHLTLRLKWYPHHNTAPSMGNCWHETLIFISLPLSPSNIQSSLVANLFKLGLLSPQHFGSIFLCPFLVFLAEFRCFTLFFSSTNGFFAALLTTSDSPSFRRTVLKTLLHHSHCGVDLFTQFSGGLSSILKTENFEKLHLSVWKFLFSTCWYLDSSPWLCLLLSGYSSCGGTWVCGIDSEIGLACFL